MTALIEGVMGLRYASGNIDTYTHALSRYMGCTSWSAALDSRNQFKIKYVAQNGCECLVYFGFHERPL